MRFQDHLNQSIVNLTLWLWLWSGLGVMSVLRSKNFQALSNFIDL